MKKLLTVLLVTLMSVTSYASHLMGGYMQSYQRGFTDTVDLYVTLFTDPQGISQTTITVNEMKKVNGFYQTQQNITITNPQTGVFQGMNVSVYHTVLVLSGGDYRFVYTNCCRGYMNNSSSSMNSNFTIGLDYMKTNAGSVPNSSPVLLNFLPSTWVTGSQQQSMIFAIDPDGDSVLIEMDDALNQHSNNTFVPLSPFYQLSSYGSYSVDPNGLIKWSPTTQGTFGTGYKISEYRNGSLIGVNRIQQVYSVVQGSTPSITAPFNMTVNNDTTITITHDLVNGDSLYVGFTASNYTSIQLFIYGIPTIAMGNTTWSLSSLTQTGTYKGFLRIYNTTSNIDYPVTLTITSTVGVEEFNNQSYNVYPNPSYDYITVDNDGIIYNNLGQQVMVVKKGLNDISTLQKGIYYISKTKIIKL